MNRLLAEDTTVLYESPDPQRVFAYTPGLIRLPGGRLIATMDQGGPGVADLRGPKGWRGEGKNAWQGRIYASDDGGKAWSERAHFPFMHARPFEAGGALYVLGHDGDLRITRSDDEGETWSEATGLTHDQHWHQSACNVLVSAGKIYLVMERRVHFEHRGWPVSELAPVLMAGHVGDDLTRRESWTFASELVFEDLPRPGMIGVPFWRPGPVIADRDDAPIMNPPGWLETNVVQFTDPHHLWHDPDGRTFHLWMRAHTGGTGLACVAKVVEAEDGSLETKLEQSPSGEPVLYVPCPGGHMRFHILHDEDSERFWLLSSLSTDSMTSPQHLPPSRFNLPNNERHILALHFSRNCIDWCMAGIVARGDDPRQARHYASMVVDGTDLHVLSRSGDHRARSAHDGNLITFHTIRNFRDLVYC